MAKSEELRERIFHEIAGAFWPGDTAHIATDHILKLLSDLKMGWQKPLELTENPYHPNPLREYDHQITEAGMIGYGEAQLDMRTAGFTHGFEPVEVRE